MRLYSWLFSICISMGLYSQSILKTPLVCTDTVSWHILDTIFRHYTTIKGIPTPCYQRKQDSIQCRCMGTFELEHTAATLTLIYQRTDTALWQYRRGSMQKNPFNLPPIATTTSNLSIVDTKTAGIKQNGGLTRGISFGNNQDVNINSKFNLEIEGAITEKVGIKGVIKDDNIPIQPEGNTQDLRNFDLIYLQFFSKKWKFTLGDYFLIQPKASYFLGFSKKVKGIEISYLDTLQNAIQGGSVAYSTTKGKFVRNSFNAIDGSAGPYRLKGETNEPFITVLATTEKVFLNGKRVDRGEDRDYIIDYNTGQITFTTKHLLTKDDRIVVEFDYSNQNFSRNVTHANAFYYTPTLKTQLHIYQEKDNKNNPIQALTPTTIQLIRTLGDAAADSMVVVADSVAFSYTQVLYRKIDTIVQNNPYTFYRYSLTASGTHYRLNFRYVGANKGNYTLLNSTINGKVYVWKSPINQVPQGDYNPTQSLAVPSQKTIITLQNTYTKGKWQISNELALSNVDKNTISKLQDTDNNGFAIKTTLQHTSHLLTIKDTLKLHYGIQHELVQRTFSTLQPYRNQEFYRDWNTNNKITSLENWVSAFFIANYSTKWTMQYQLGNFSQKNNYTGIRQEITTTWTPDTTFKINYQASYTYSTAAETKKKFYRHITQIQKKWRTIQATYKDDIEYNMQRKDTIANTSYLYYNPTLQIDIDITPKLQYSMYQQARYDWKYPKNTIHKIATSTTTGAAIQYLYDDQNYFKLQTNYRKLTILDTLLSSTKKSEKTLQSILDYRWQGWNKTITIQGMYQLQTLVEPQYVMTYIPVSTGQGTHNWVDYNQDSIPQINEFEKAIYNYQANYLPFYSPTTNVVRVINKSWTQQIATQFSQSASLPSFFKKIYLQTNLQIQQKTNTTNFFTQLTPYQKNSTNLLTNRSNIKQGVHFQKNHAVWGAGTVFMLTSNKSFLNNGFAYQQAKEMETYVFYKLNDSLTFTTKYILSQNVSSTDFSTTRNFTIHATTIQQEIQYKWRGKNSVQLTGIYSNKYTTNKLEQAINKQLTLQYTYQVIPKNILLLKSSFLHLTYYGTTNTPIAYELLQSLQKGTNWVNTISWNKNITSTIRLLLAYENRKNTSSDWLHWANMQLQIIF